MDQRFRQHERLKSRKQIQQLFKEGKALKGFPVLGIYSTGFSHRGVQVGFSVSRKKIKKAVDRNLVKRRMREAYRLNRDKVGVERISGVALMLIYLKSEPEDFRLVEKGVQKILKKLVEVNSADNEQSEGD